MLLLDANVSPRLVQGLTEEGHDVRHVADLGPTSATDAELFDRGCKTVL
jgi:predicted nuclease of predicted toxin-antitoxin system